MEEPDPDKLKGPGGLTLRQIHEQVKLSTARDQLDRTLNNSTETVGRWQRFVRYFRKKRLVKS
ncbi:hypothetical protein [Nitrosospira sp. Nsp2]|uniref:hypothetical protein n=1 Tax=Nitrosospira sp. Nsp2 TaxID=136548 RepID=UPI000D2FE044|nr:hypothetical protein [Nitrosospira sp. Nsp2]